MINNLNTCNATPTEDSDAVTKKYVDANASFINKADKNLDTSSFKITDLATPTKNKDATTKKYVDEKTGSVNKANKNLDMSSFKITNLLTPTEDKDAATKAYVDGKSGAIKYLHAYKRVNENYKPTFWISSKFPFGFEEDQLTIQDLTGTGFTITGGAVTKNLSINANTTLRSPALYDTEFTFFVKAKRTSDSGRIFTSSTSNKVLGWWNEFAKCAWMDGNIYGFTGNKTSSNLTSVYTSILINNADNKTFDQYKTEIITTLEGADSWNGNIVLGRPVQSSNESGAGQFFEVIGFDKVLTKAQIDDIYDSILT